MNPFSLILALFIAVPLVEMYVLIKVGGVIGALPTIFLVVFTAFLGVFLIRIQGFSTLQRIRATLDAGGIPAIEMMEGVFLFLAGALLLTPGFVTDSIGFLCLIPPVRRAVILSLIQRWQISLVKRQAANPSRPTSSGKVIEGELSVADKTDSQDD